MTRLMRSLLVATMLSAWFIAGLRSPVTNADCGGSGYVRHLEDAQGVAFIGTFEGKRRKLTAEGNRDPFYHWRIDRTVAGPPASEYPATFQVHTLDDALALLRGEPPLTDAAIRKTWSPSAITAFLQFR